MWKIEIKDAAVADPNLLEMDAECPTQFRKDDGGVGLRVAIWCKRSAYPVKIRKNEGLFSFGFTEGELSVQAIGLKIAIEQRFSDIAYKKDFSSSEQSHSEKSGGLEGNASLSAAMALGSSKNANLDASINGKASKASTQTNQIEQEHSQTQYRVRPSGLNTWLLNGTGLNDENVLDEQILGDSLLCHLNKTTSSNDAAITVQFHYDTLHLWVDADEISKYKSTLSRKPIKETNIVKSAILTALVAKTLTRKHNVDAVIEKDSKILVASQEITLSLLENT